MENISIYNYLDYRAFLRDLFEAIKQANTVLQVNLQLFPLIKEKK